MPFLSITPAPGIDDRVVRRLYERGDGDRWALGVHYFAEALGRSAAHRFRDAKPSAREVEHYLDSLHLEDLALACACARGSERAWEHFIGSFRPILYRLASRGAPAHRSREAADSIYAELFGLDLREGVRRSLFDYYHGRSSLAGWLRAVLAQRVVDLARVDWKFEPIEDAERLADRSVSPDEPDIDRDRYIDLARAALAAAIAGLEARDRLRLSLYYGQGMTLAAIGRVLGESEATASRKLERTRRELRTDTESRLRDVERLTHDQITLCFEYLSTDPAFDLSRAMPQDGQRWWR
jgi:RNA polymerase sigma-70 factor